MKVIVTPTDFSTTSKNAVRYAADLANMLGFRLHLLHIYAIPAPVSEVPIPFNIDEAEADALRMLQEFKEELLTRTSNRLDIHLDVRGGNVISEIRDYCETAKPYMVILGAETAGSFERILFGGKTLTAVRRFQWPTLIVPPRATFKNIRRIAVACDFRDVSETVRAVEIRELVNQFKAELHVLYVGHESREGYDPETVEESAIFQELLGDLKPKYHFLENDDTDVAVAEYADTHDIDILIIVPKKHSLLHSLFHHSHSKRVILYTDVPVISLHE